MKLEHIHIYGCIMEAQRAQQKHFLGWYSFSFHLWKYDFFLFFLSEYSFNIFPSVKQNLQKGSWQQRRGKEVLPVVTDGKKNILAQTKVFMKLKLTLKIYKIKVKKLKWTFTCFHKNKNHTFSYRWHDDDKLRKWITSLLRVSIVYQFHALII